MRSSCNECDLGVGQRRADERAAVILFVKVREYQPLPIDVKRVLGQASVKYQPRALGLGLNKKLHLRIVAKRFEMPDAFNGIFYRLFIDNSPFFKLNRHTESLHHELLYDLKLNFAHETKLNLTKMLVPRNPKLSFLLFKLLSSPMQIFTRRQLMDEIWGYDSESDTHTVDVHIGRLRERFRDSRDFRIVTMRGVGYKVVKV